MDKKLKNCTSLEQSQKLAEILPLESADMFHAVYAEIVVTTPYITYLNGERNIPAYKGAIPCWSLAALLSVIPNYRLISEHINCHTCTAETPFGDVTVPWFDNPIDACYELILKLHEKKLLFVKNN